MNRLKIALDWTPNANHIGFFIAKELGYYSQVDLQVDIVTPGEDDYKMTPAKKVEIKKVDLALCPLESIMSYRSKLKPFNLTAIAALFKEDLSAIVVKENSGIKSPKDLDNKLYASYDARYEDEIVKQMIVNDGGDGTIYCVYPSKLDIWDDFKENRVESTWIFMNWEAVEAQDAMDLKFFKLKDYNIPYSYSPVIACGEDTMEHKKSELRAFLNATKRGFYYAQKNPTEAAAVLKNLVTNHDRSIDLEKAITITCDALPLENKWGMLEIESVTTFLKWLQSKNLEKHNLTASSLFTNELLKM